MTGKTVGNLLVIRRVFVKKWIVHWECKCICGNTKVVAGGHLGKGTVSCGCVKLQQISIAQKTHGMSKTRIYNIWCKMIARCEDPKNNRFSRYGGRGISVCNEWKSFESFFKDMGNPPSLSHSIDRIENNGNYEKSNCKWSTPKQQANNRAPRSKKHKGV